MRIFSGWVAAVVLGLGLSVSGANARGDEEKVPLDKVPAPVLNAVKAKYPGASIKGASKEVEDGKTIYEVELTHDGQAVDLSLKPDGTIIEAEKEIKPENLPAAVSKGLKAKYPTAPIKKAEEVTKGTTVTYEVVIEKSPGKRVEVVLDKSGKILEEEGGDEKKD